MKRRLNINLSQLESANFFGWSSSEANEFKPMWVAAMELLGARDSQPLRFFEGSIGAVDTITVDDLVHSEGEQNEDAPEYLWFDKISDEAMEIANA